MDSLEKKYIVGLAGGIGSGKSTIATKFQQHGIQYIDADDVAREVVAIDTPCLAEISKRFGQEVLLEDGTLNRRKLRHIIFNDTTEKEWLEQLTHPVIHAQITQHLLNSTSLYVLLVHPLLFETKKNEICDYTVAISVSIDVQLKRVCERDKVTKDIAESIISSQLSNGVRSKKANQVIENSSCPTELDDKITNLHKQLSALAHAKYN